MGDLLLKKSYKACILTFFISQALLFSACLDKDDDLHLNQTGTLPVALKVYTLEDSQGTLSFGDVIRRNSDFIYRENSNIYFNLEPENVWVRVDYINSTNEDQNVFLVPHRESLLYVEYYTEENGEWKISKGGYSAAESEMIKRDPLAFPASIKAHSEKTIYLKLSGAFIKIFVLKLFNQQGLNKFIKIRNFIQIFSTSLMWIMISISFYNFIFLRNSIYLLYSLSMLGIWMLFFGHRGSALEMLSFFDPQITLNILYSILPLTVFFGLQYICKLMQIEKTLPVPGRILQILVYSLFALFVLQIFISFDTVFFLTHLTSLITLILFTIFSIAAALKGSRSSKLTALPTFFMMLFMGIMHIHNLNIFSINQFAAAIILILTPLDLIYISVVHKIWRNETASSFSKGSTVLISGIKIDNEIQMMPYNKIHDKNILQDEPQHSAETQIASGLKHNSTSTACAEKKKTIYLKQDRIQDHISRLNKVMMEDKLFLLEDLRASQLASALDIKTHHLTELLNKHMGVSFPDLVKKYRVEESIQLIKENPEKKFITIAFETGFQSKSAFNRSFKEVTGLTPNEYRMGLRFNSNL